MKRYLVLIAIVIALGVGSLFAKITINELNNNVNLHVPKTMILSQLGQPDDVVKNEVFSMEFELYKLADSSVIKTIFLAYDETDKNYPVCLIGLIFRDNVSFESYVDDIKSRGDNIEILLEAEYAFIYTEITELGYKDEYIIVEKSESGLITYSTLSKQFFSAFPQFKPKKSK